MPDRQPINYGKPITPTPVTTSLRLVEQNVYVQARHFTRRRISLFDLDVVIIDNIDSLFEFDGFGIARDFVRPDSGILGGKEYNSSVMKFTQNQRL